MGAMHWANGQAGPRGGASALASLACVAGVLFLVAVVGAALLQAGPDKARAEARRIRCRNNLNMFAKGVATYLNELGDNRFYPWPAGRAGCGGEREKADFGGAEWLASLYWTKIIPDPEHFLCPSSGDDNGKGEKLGTAGCPQGKDAPKDGKLGPRAVSYAGFGADSVAVWLKEKMKKEPKERKMALRDDFPPNEPMACDDTEDPINHSDEDAKGMSVMFFDSHVEFWTADKVNLERGVGSGDLVALRN
ncbi:MAG: hypothetical protein FJ291_11085 [Planctomycetes bacterium]|nr:hypothetical protein [Planctomycetota bacterium]